MSTRRIVTPLVAGLVTLLFTSTLRSQHSPEGWIEARAWNLLFPLSQPFGGHGSPILQLDAWLHPHRIELEDPRPGDVWDDLDFGGEALVTGHGFGGLFGPSDPPTWVTLDVIEEELGLPRGALPDGDLINYQGMVDVVNSRLGGDRSRFLAGDNVLGVATTYVRNLTGAPLLVDVCTASDDSIRVWVNCQLVANVIAARGAGPRCQETNPAMLIPGVNKIVTMVWEGGGGWGFRVGVRLPGETEHLADGNGLVEFMGTGADDADAMTPEQLCISREESIRTLQCPDDVVDITLRARGRSDAEKPVTIVEEILGHELDAVRIPFISDGGRIEIDVVSGALFSATGSGEIGPSCDTLQFDSVTIEGDFDVAVEILAIDTVHPDGVRREASSGVAGVMARESLSRDARFAATMMPGFGGRSAPLAVSRVAEGEGACAMTRWRFESSRGQDPFLRLARSGQIVRSWSSGDPRVGRDELDPGSDDGWQLIDTVDFEGALGDSLLVGFANAVPGRESAPSRVVFRPLAGAFPHGFESSAFIGENTNELAGTRPGDYVRGVRVVWDTSVGATESGLEYRLSFEGRGELHTSGFVDDYGPITASDAAPLLRFDSAQSSPVGVFEAAHEIGAPRAGVTTFEAKTGVYTAHTPRIEDPGADDLHLAYSRVRGDFVLTSRFIELVDPEPDVGSTRRGWFGLTARESCEPTAKSVSLMEFFRRPDGSADNPEFEGSVVSDGVLPGFELRGDITARRRPEWMRLERIDPTLYGFLAFDRGGEALEWCLVGSITELAMPEELVVGVALSTRSIDGASLTFDNVSIEKRVQAPESDAGTIEAGSNDFDSADALVAATIVSTGEGVPKLVDGELRLSGDRVESSKVAAWFCGDDHGLDAGVGFEFEFAARALCDAGGSAFAVVQGDCDDAFLDVPTLVGSGDFGWSGGAVSARVECHPSFALRWRRASSSCDMGVQLAVNGDWQPLNGWNVAIPSSDTRSGVRFSVRYDAGGRVRCHAIAGDSRVLVADEFIPPLHGVVVFGFTGENREESRNSSSVDSLRVRRLCSPFEPGCSGRGRIAPFDLNADRAVDLSDAIRLLETLFVGGGSRLPCASDRSNAALADFNGDGATDLSDAVAALGWLFLGREGHAAAEACIELEGCPAACA